MIKKILFAWLGNTDLRAAEANGAEGLGPVAEAVKERGYPCVRLLCNYGRKKAPDTQSGSTADSRMLISP